MAGVTAIAGGRLPAGRGRLAVRGNRRADTKRPSSRSFRLRNAGTAPQRPKARRPRTPTEVAARPDIPTSSGGMTDGRRPRRHPRGRVLLLYFFSCVRPQAGKKTCLRGARGHHRGQLRCMHPLSTSHVPDKTQMGCVQGAWRVPGPLQVCVGVCGGNAGTVGLLELLRKKQKYLCWLRYPLSVSLRSQSFVPRTHGLTHLKKDTNPAFSCAPPLLVFINHTHSRYVTYRPAVSLGRTMRTTCPRARPK